MGFITNSLALIGAVWVSQRILNVYRFFIIFLRTSNLRRYHHTSKKGALPWAFVTGASDGIGKGYSHELASQGFNLILHGRNPAKLQAVELSLHKTNPNIKTRIVISDTCKSGPESIQEINAIVESIKDLHITVLVNNVGTGTRPTGHVFSNFERDIPSDIDGMINTNARFPAQITRAILPLLLSHAQPALILTMCSIAEAGSPYLSVYSATKAFDSSFSRALKREMDGEHPNIEVLAIMTAQVTGTATNDTPTAIVKPDARAFARYALGRVGCGFDVVEGFWIHALLHGVLKMLPDIVFTTLLRNSIRDEMKLKGKSA